MAVSVLAPLAVSGPSQKPASDATSSAGVTGLHNPLTVLHDVLPAPSHLSTPLTCALASPPPETPFHLLPTVPLIDLGPSFDGNLSSRQAVACQIRAACLATGFFQVSNHSIPESAADGVLHQASRFFHDLTQAQKDALHV